MLTVSGYLENAVAGFWRYRASHFGDHPEYFDRACVPTTRPPVFAKPWLDQNVLVAPDVPSDRKTEVRALLAPRQRHRWFGSMKSSQALAQSVFANLSVLGKLHLLSEVRDENGHSAFADHLSSRAVALEHEITQLSEPRPTSVDVYFKGDYRVAVECKLTEEDVGWCSRPTLSPCDSNFDSEHCSGTYSFQRGRSHRCSLAALGVKYWHYIPALLNWSTEQDHDPCPLRRTYQLVRNVLAACVREDGRLCAEGGHALLLYDERTPGFTCGGNGWKAYTTVRGALKNPSLLRRCTWQRLLRHLGDDPGLAWLLDGLGQKYGLHPV